MKHNYTGKLPEQPWTEEKIIARINGAKGRMKLMTQRVNDCIKLTSALRQERLELQTKISDAHIYINQLENQLSELKNNQP